MRFVSGRCITGADGARGSAHRGLIYPPEPMGCEYDGGGIFGKDAAENELAFSYHQCGSQREVWIDRFVRREGKSAIWQVEDMLVLPRLEKLESVFDFDCEYRTDKAVFVIAIGTWVNRDIGGAAKKIRHAWMIDVKSRRFKSVPGSTVSCAVLENRD